MESAVLTKARRQLAAWLILFASGLVFAVTLQTSNQNKESNRREQQRTLEMLGWIAAETFQDTPKNPESLSMKTPWGGERQVKSRSESTADVRILWIGPSMEILQEYGSFVPGGRLVPAPSKRQMPQEISLSNGAGLWLPVTTSGQPSQAGRVHGYLAIAIADVDNQRESWISLVAATTASLLLGLLGIPWILERSLQPLRQQVNRLNQFAGDVAHELRNPLMALKTTVANTRSDIESESASKLENQFRTLDRIATKMANILDDILLLTQVENTPEKSENNSAEYYLNEVFDELYILHDSEARKKELRLTFGCDETIRLRLAPARLQRILSNLISNAIRHSLAGSSVEVRAAVHGTSTQITVDDQGPGIPTDQQDRVFERFVRLQDGEDDVPHAGIGLALCRSLARLHGGSLKAMQSPSGGCRMLLTLPMDPPGQGLRGLNWRWGG